MSRDSRESPGGGGSSGRGPLVRMPRLWKQLLSSVGEEDALEELRLLMAQREAHRAELQRSRSAGAPVNPQVRKAVARTDARLARVRERLRTIRRARVAALSYTSPSMGEVRIVLPPVTVGEQREAERHSSSPPAQSRRRSVEQRRDDERPAKPASTVGGMDGRDADALAIMFDGLKNTRAKLNELTGTLSAIGDRVEEDFCSVHACTHEERQAMRVLAARLEDARALGDSKTDKVSHMAAMRYASARHELDDALNATADRGERLDAAEARLRHVADALDARQRRHARHMAASGVQSASAAVRYMCQLDAEWLSHAAFALGLIVFYYAVLPALWRI